MELHVVMYNGDPYTVSVITRKQVKFLHLHDFDHHVIHNTTDYKHVILCFSVNV